MAGVRIQHPTARSCRFTVVESSRPYPVPYPCTPPEFGGCGTTHLFKTHHLNLDDAGSVIVGDVLFHRIKHVLVLNGFTVQGDVPRPPTIVLGLGPQRAGAGAWPEFPIIHGTGG